MARLAYQPLWWDEGWSLYFAATDVREILALTAVDIHPPLYYLLLHGWIGLFEPGPLSVRLLSVLIGVAAIPVIYLVGRRLLGRGGGLLAALLLAISPFHIYYSQEVRMYGLVTLLGLLAWYFSLGWVQASRSWPGWGAWVGYVLAAAAALYTQYYAAWLLLALNVAVLSACLLQRQAGRRLWTWLGAQAAVAALFLPWLWYAGDKLLTYVQYKVTADKDVVLGPLTYLARHLAALGWGHAEGALAGWWWIGLLPAAALALIAVLAVAARRDARGDGSRSARAEGWPMAALIVGVLLACGYAVNVVLPFNPVRGERLLLLALPAFTLLLAAGLLALWRIRPRHGLAIGVAGVVLITALVSLAFFYTVPRYAADDYRPVAARLQALALPGDVVVAVHPWQVGYLDSYLAGSPVKPTVVLSPHEVLPRERQYWADDPARMASDLDGLLAEHGRLWLPAHQSMGRVLEDQIEAYLAGHSYPVLSEWHGPHTLLSLYDGGEPATEGGVATFGDWLALDGAALSSEPLAAGRGVLDARLTWRLAGASPAGAGDYRIGLRLTDAVGRTWAQRDSLPLGGLGSFAGWSEGEAVEDRHGLLVPAGTPPGDYQVTLRVYSPDTFDVLPATFAGGSGGEAVLGTVRVVRPEQSPPVTALDVEQPLRANFGPLRLLGLTQTGGSTLHNGEATAVDLFWQALAAPGEDFLPRLQLVDAAGQVQAELVEKPVAGAYPTAWWQAGELVRDPHLLPVPAQAAPGRYRLVLSLVRAADGAPVATTRGQTSLDLGSIEVVGREHSFEPATPQHTQQAGLGPAVELAGYDLGQDVARPGSTLPITLYWHALSTPDRAYLAFVHVLDAAGEIVAQHDGVPGEGTLPTLGWLPGETLADRHEVPLPAGLPAGEYRLAAGLYDPVTRQRLGERVILDTPLVVEAEP